MNVKETNLNIYLCRICMVESGNVNLDELVIDLSVINVIKKIFNISVLESDRCPASICSYCFEKVKTAYEIRNSISRAEEKWKKLCANDAEILKIDLQNGPALIENNKRTGSASQNVCPKIANKRKEHKCKKCEKILYSTTALKTHMTTHTGHKPFKCDVCQKTFSNSGNLYSHKKIHGAEKSFICEICSKQFVFAYYLKQHMRTHKPDAERQINCDHCDKIFRTKRFYLMHLKKHDGIRDVACITCKKMFYHKRDLNRHIRTTHLEIKKFKCLICSRAFSNSGNLTAHKRIHTGEKPYECKYCEARFNQSTPLVRHTKIHIEKGHSLKPVPIDESSNEGTI